MLLLLMLILAFAVGGGYAFYIVQPLTAAIRDKSSSWRFCACDLFSLSILVAIPFGLTKASLATVHRLDQPIVQGVGIVLSVVWCVIWYRDVLALTTAGVTSALKRFVFMSFLLPAAIIGGGLVVPALLMIALLSFDRSDESGVLTWLAYSLVMFLLALGGRWATHWVLSSKKGQEPFW